MGKKNDDEEKFTHFQATLALKAAIRENKINLQNDPLYSSLKEAEHGIMIGSRVCQVIAVLLPVWAIYNFRYKHRFPIPEILLKIFPLYGALGVGYYINPSMSRYNEIIMEISLRRKDELQTYVESHKKSE